MNQSWAEKYRPRRYTELIFNGDIHHDALRWLKEYPDHGRVLLLNGPPGTGKTSLVHVLASVFDHNLVEFNASNDSGYVDKILEMSGTIDGKRNLILIDEIDNNPSVDLSKLMNSANLAHPVILTSNEMHVKGVHSLNMYSLNVRRPDIDEIRQGVRRVCEGENIQIDTSILHTIVDDSGHDFRAIINYLQMCGDRMVTNRNYRGMCKSTPLNQYKVVELILSKYIEWKRYEDMYSSHVLSLCHSSFVHNTDVLRCIVDISESTSLMDILPDEYRYISLSKYNRCCSRNVEISRVEYHKEEIRTVLMERILPYFKKYDLTRSDGRSLSHLREMVRMYKIEGVEVREEENTIKSESTAKFRFRYKNGQSSAVRRNVTVDDIMG